MVLTDTAEGAMPDKKRSEQQGQQQTRTASVPDSERAIRKISQRRADRGSRHNRCPVQERMEFCCLDLRDHGGQEDCRENAGADQIAEVHGHRNGITAGFAQRGGGNLDEPEAKRHFWDFGQSVFSGGFHGLPSLVRLGPGACRRF
jgi:hypothetical protein